MIIYYYIYIYIPILLSIGLEEKLFSEYRDLIIFSNINGIDDDDDDNDDDDDDDDDDDLDIDNDLDNDLDNKINLFFVIEFKNILIIQIQL